MTIFKAGSKGTYLSGAPSNMPPYSNSHTPCFKIDKNCMLLIILGCKPPFSQCGSSCFYVSAEKFTWENGKDECHQIGGHLAMIKTAERQHEVYEYLEDIWDPTKCQSKGVLTF